MIQKFIHLGHASFLWGHLFIGVIRPVRPVYHKYSDSLVQDA